MLLTTHYMFEADELCDRIAVIAGGRIVAEGTPDAAQAAGDAAGTSSRSRCSASAHERLVAVRALPGVTSVTVEERGQAQLLVVRAERRRARSPRASSPAWTECRSAGS